MGASRRVGVGETLTLTLILLESCSPQGLKRGCGGGRLLRSSSPRALTVCGAAAPPGHILSALFLRRWCLSVGARKVWCVDLVTFNRTLYISH